MSVGKTVSYYGFDDRWANSARYWLADPRSTAGRSSGVPVVTDRETQRALWRAGDSENTPAAGELVLESAVEVRLRDGGVWRSSLAARGAHYLVVTDDGELELLDERGVGLYNSRQGFIGPQPVFEDSAPAADITLKRYLCRKGTTGASKGAVTHTVMRELDGSLRVSARNVSYNLSTPLARWLEQDNTVLAWRQLPSTQGTDLALCLIDTAIRCGEKAGPVRA